jgi:hypothetical protein
LHVETLRDVGRFLLVRSFTPIGLVLALWGLRGGDRLWRVWGASAAAALALLAGKLHHEYYWLALAPPAAAGVGRALATLAKRRPWATAALGGALIVLSMAQARATWRTPPEWAALPEAARAVRDAVPPGAWVVAPEALLYAADRPGCRLEFAPAAARRAAGEWGGGLELDRTLNTGPGADPEKSGPLALVEFYEARGAGYVAVPGVAVPGRPTADGGRQALRRAIRRRYRIVVDRPAVLIAALNGPEGSSPDGKGNRK